MVDLRMILLIIKGAAAVVVLVREEEGEGQWNSQNLCKGS